MARRIEVEIVGSSASVERSFSRASRSATNFASSLKRAEASQFAFIRGVTSTTGAMSKFGGVLALTSMSFFTGAGFGAALTSTVKKAAQFEQALNILQVTTRATGGAMRQAGDLARKLGADISIPGASAADAANAMTELAKGGLTLTDAMAAARGTLQMSAAANLTVADAAKITVSALNAFSLSGTEALHVANLLAGAAAASQGEIADMALALQQAAAQAHASGLSIEETITGLSLLAKAGISASDAGTSFRRLLQQLVPSSKKAAEEIKRLNVEVYDASGRLKSLPGIINTYRGALDRLNPKQRQFALYTIFGSDASRAAAIIFSTTAKQYDAMYAAVNRTNAAQVLASARMKGAVGAAAALRNAIDTLQINIGSKLLPTFTPLIQDLGDWVARQAEAEQRTHRIANAVTAFTDAITAAIRVLRPFTDAALGLSRAFGVGPILAFYAGTKLARAGISLFEGSQKRLGTVTAATTARLAEEAKAAASARAAATAAAGALIVIPAAPVKATARARAAAGAAVTPAATAAATAAAAAPAALGRSAALAAVQQQRLAQATELVTAAEAEYATALRVGVPAQIAAARASMQQALAVQELAASENAILFPADARLLKMTEALAVAQTELAAAQKAGVGVTVAQARVAEVQAGILARQNMLAAAAVGATRGPYTRVTQVAAEAAALRGFAGSAAAAERASVSLGAKLRTAGTGALALVGGWKTLAVVGAAAVAAGIYKIATAESDWDRVNRRLDASLRSLGTAMDAVKQTTLDLAQARLDVPTAQQAVSAAKLVVQQDRVNVRLARAKGDATEYARAVDQLNQDLLALQNAQLQVQRAQQGLTAAGRAARAARDENARAITSEVTALQRLAGAAREEATLFARQQLRAGRGGAFDVATEGVTRFTAALQKEADRLRGDHPLLARNIRLLGQFAAGIRDMPTPKEIQFFVNNKQAKVAIADLIRRLAEMGDPAAKAAVKAGLQAGNAFGLSFMNAVDAQLQGLPGIVGGVFKRAAEQMKPKEGEPGFTPRARQVPPLGALAQAQLAESLARLGVAMGRPGAQVALVKALQQRIAYDRKYEAVQLDLIRRGIGDRKKHVETLTRLRDDEASALNEIANMEKERAQKRAQYELPVALQVAQARAEALGRDTTSILRQIVASATRALRSGRLNWEGQIAAWNAINSANEALKAFTISPELQLALAKAEALGKDTTSTLKKMRDAAYQAIRSGRLGIDGQIAAWNEIKNINDQLGDSAVQTFKKISARKVAAGLGLTGDALKALQARLSLIGSQNTAPRGGFTGAFGYAIPVTVGGGPDIVVQSTINLDGQKVATNTTRHQQKGARRNPPQKRGPNAGGR